MHLWSIIRLEIAFKKASIQWTAETGGQLRRHLTSCKVPSSRAVYSIHRETCAWKPSGLQLHPYKRGGWFLRESGDYSEELNITWSRWPALCIAMNYLICSDLTTTLADVTICNVMIVFRYEYCILTWRYFQSPSETYGIEYAWLIEYLLMILMHWFTQRSGPIMAGHSQLWKYNSSNDIHICVV